MPNRIAHCLPVALLTLTTALLSAAITASAEDSPRPLSIDDIMAMQSVRDPQISPDGNWVAYSVSRMDLRGGQKPHADLDGIYGRWRSCSNDGARQLR
jgi:hypothetical protein